MKLKRILCAALLLALGLTMFGACGNSKKPENADEPSSLSEYSNPYLDALPVAGNWGGYEWVVIKKEDTRQLCITKEIIEVRRFHEAEATVSWAESDLRAYLNGEFYETVFKADKSKNAVRPLSVNNANKSVNFPNDNAGIGSTATKDSVFLLSYEEAETCFLSDAARVAAYDGRSQIWWLRSPGDHLNYYANVDGIGQVCYSSSNLQAEGFGVRPATWIPRTAEYSK